VSKSYKEAAQKWLKAQLKIFYFI